MVELTADLDYQTIIGKTQDFGATQKHHHKQQVWKFRFRSQFRLFPFPSSHKLAYTHTLISHVKRYSAMRWVLRYSFLFYFIPHFIPLFTLVSVFLIEFGLFVELVSCSSGPGRIGYCDITTACFVASIEMKQKKAMFSINGCRTSTRWSWVPESCRDRWWMLVHSFGRENKKNDCLRWQNNSSVSSAKNQ